MGIYKKFKSIKLSVIEGRKLKPFMVAKILQDHEDRLVALEGDSTDSGQEQTGTQEQDNTQQQTTTRDLTFTVNDGTDPIQGATVTIGTKTGTTGSAGGCSINGVEEGTNISVEVSKEGYTTKTETITVDSTHTSFTISLVAVSSP